MGTPADNHHIAAICTFALQFPNGEFIIDPSNWMRTTKNLSDAHIWLWPLDESDEARAARIVAVKKRMKYPPDGKISAVRAR